MVYEVMDQPFDKMHVFKIKPVEGNGKCKVVHQNLLLPLYPECGTNTDQYEKIRYQNIRGIKQCCVNDRHNESLAPCDQGKDVVAKMLLFNCWITV